MNAVLGSGGCLWPSQISSSAKLLQGCLSNVRMVSVLSWGSNTSHQCGIEGDQPLVLQPTAVLDLLQQPVTAIAAGRNNSAAVLQDQYAYTWGEGLDGKLALGSGERARCPSRVEALVGQCSIQRVSLGHHHSLFLDSGGRLWAAGENKEGQCGLGTPLAELARAHRQAYEDAMRRMGVYVQQPDPMSKYKRVLQQASAGARATAGAAGAAHIAHGWGTLGGSQEAHVPAAWGEPEASLSGLSNGGSFGKRRSWLSLLGNVAGAADANVHMRALQMQPGQAHLPVRVGCEGAHTLLQQQQQQQQQQVHADGRESESTSSGSLADEVIVDMAASKYFSAAVTNKGEVWTFGACYNGALGSGAGSSWQATPTRVADPIAAAIAARGGAVKVAAGSTFTAVLTASGRVLLWGKLVSNSNRAISISSSSSSNDSSTASNQPAWSEVGLSEGVHISHIAAGQQHLLMSDGERVWAVGRWMDASGLEAGCAPAEAPEQLLALPSTGITRLSAGMHASGCVDRDGQLWLWGRLLDQTHAQGMATAGVLPVGGSSTPAAAAAMMQAADTMRKLGQTDWAWAGFGGAAPRRVEGLQGVCDVALGGWHALVLTK